MISKGQDTDDSSNARNHNQQKPSSAVVASTLGKTKTSTRQTELQKIPKKLRAQSRV